MSEAISSVGTKFRRWSDGAIWVDIAEITNLGGPDMSKDTIDVTSLDSVGGYRKFISGFRDGGTISITMNFTRAGYEMMKNDFDSDLLRNYEIFLPDTDETSLEFEGLVTELSLTNSTDSQITADVSIKVSGEPVLNSGSGSGS